MILLSGWGLGAIFDSIKEASVNSSRSALQILFTTLLVISLFVSIASLISPTPPFQGKDMASLQATYAFLLPALTLVASIIALVYMMKDDLVGLIRVGLSTLSLLGIIGTITSALSFVSVTRDILSTWKVRDDYL